MKRYLPILLLIACSAPKPATLSLFKAPAPIQINKPQPKITPNRSLKLSEYTTKFKHEGKYSTRADNIKLAASKLNGYILEPGQEFSFNKVVGERSAVAGFKEAPVIFMGELDKGLGGGTCQVSSTLYAASMFGGLQVIKRVSHSRPSDYIPKGMDATVSYPDLDLVLKNNYDKPLEIAANASDGKLNIQILGATTNFKLRYYFIGGKTDPFKKRVIRSKYYKKEPRIKQKGKDGTPGLMFWIYNIEGDKRQISAVSNYRPIDEVWIADLDTPIPDSEEFKEGENELLQ